MDSETCIDNIDIQAKIENGVIEDIRFDGEACAICTSSTSIMTELLIWIKQLMKQGLLLKII